MKKLLLCFSIMSLVGVTLPTNRHGFLVSPGTVLLVDPRMPFSAPTLLSERFPKKISFKANETTNKFSCSRCDYTDKRKQNLANHILNKENIMIRCLLCGCTMNQADFVTLHRKKCACMYSPGEAELRAAAGTLCYLSGGGNK